MTKNIDRKLVDQICCDIKNSGVVVIQQVRKEMIVWCHHYTNLTRIVGCGICDAHVVVHLWYQIQMILIFEVSQKIARVLIVYRCHDRKRKDHIGYAISSRHCVLNV